MDFIIILSLTSFSFGCKSSFPVIYGNYASIRVFNRKRYVSTSTNDLTGVSFHRANSPSSRRRRVLRSRNATAIFLASDAGDFCTARREHFTMNSENNCAPRGERYSPSGGGKVIAFRHEKESRRVLDSDGLVAMGKKNASRGRSLDYVVVLSVRF